jgi:hypothetical protein
MPHFYPPTPIWVNEIRSDLVLFARFSAALGQVRPLGVRKLGLAPTDSTYGTYATYEIARGNLQVL